MTWPIMDHTMVALRLADRATLDPILRRSGVSNSDYYPTLDLNAERTRFMRTSASGLSGLSTGAVSLPAIASGRRAGIGDPYAEVSGIYRLDAMAVNAAMRLSAPRAGYETPAAAETLLNNEV